MEKVVDVMSVTNTQLLEHLHWITKHLEFWSRLSTVRYIYFSTLLLCLIVMERSVQSDGSIYVMGGRVTRVISCPS